MTKYLTANDDLDQLKINKHILDVVDYVDDMFKAAIDLWASDIHVEPTEYFILIRFRKDWDFFIIDKVDREFTSAIITRLKVLSRIKIDENKKYTVTDLDYTFIVRAEEEAYESTETRNAIRRNVAIYIKNENIDSKVSLVMIKQPHGEVKFYFNQDDSFYNFDWVERNLTKFIEFIFYGIE